MTILKTFGSLPSGLKNSKMCGMWSLGTLSHRGTTTLNSYVTKSCSQGH